MAERARRAEETRQAEIKRADEARAEMERRAALAAEPAADETQVFPMPVRGRRQKGSASQVVQVQPAPQSAWPEQPLLVQ